MEGGKRNFDKAAADWDNNGRIKMAQNIGAAILRAVKVSRDMDVLDFGCGTGLLTLQLASLARAVIGVDSSAGMLQVLKQKIEAEHLDNITLELLDVENGDRLRGAYDLVTSSMTLHHIREIKPLLGQFFQILKPGGWLCLADLDPDQGFFHGLGQNDGVFHFGFDRQALGRDLGQAGFAGVEFVTAAEIVRFYPGGVRPFGIFLATARRPRE